MRPGGTIPLTVEIGDPSEVFAGASGGEGRNTREGTVMVRSRRRRGGRRLAKRSRDTSGQRLEPRFPAIDRIGRQRDFAEARLVTAIGACKRRDSRAL